MRSIALGMIALFVFTVSVVLSPLQAQGADSMVVNVPFEFNVGDEALPAGRYLVERLSPTSTCVIVRSAEDGPSAAALTAGSLQADGTARAPRLVFKEYGGVHFLSEVWAQGGGSGVEVSTSHDERALAKVAARAVPVVVLAR